MQVNWSSFQDDLGYTELFHIPAVTSVSFEISGGLSVVSSSNSMILTCLSGHKALLCMQCRGIGPHLSARGKFHGFSQVAVGTCGTFSSYGRGSH